MINIYPVVIKLNGIHVREIRILTYILHGIAQLTGKFHVQVI
jgi:hypothetical protein